ncbi:MAG: ATP-binding cassette domain-containing protein [Cloacibacillus sp.]
MKDNVLIDVKNLKKYFYKDTGIISKKMQEIKAVDDVSFYIKKGETLGLVGESGCGKTTAGRTIMRLYEPTGGQILYNETDIAKLSQKDFMPYRKKIQMIFQDPYASLDPRMTVADIIGEPLDIHHLASGKERQERIFELLDKVGLGKNHANRYPHEFSGGQRQRIGIARALSVMPEFIICDEPISALDVSVQAQVVNMLEDLQHEIGLTYLFIAHDLSMVRHISDRVGVMYLGSLMELTTSDTLYNNPQHPYTQALLSSIPIPNPRAEIKNIILEGDVPSPLNPPSGCKFRTRCRYTKKICAEETPRLKEIGAEHFAACHLF